MRTYLSICSILVLSAPGFSQELRLGMEYTSLEESADPETWELNDLDLVADMTVPMLQYANIAESFTMGLVLAEESDEDHYNFDKVGSPDREESLVNHDDDVWTQVGLYGNLLGISGDANIGYISAEADVSFSDILSSLDLGGMAFVEHRRGNWSFILDVAYLKISADASARNPLLSLELDAEFEQFLAEGFVGYRVFDRDYDNTRLGIDVLGGVRYNHIGVDLGAQAGLLGLASGSREANGDWVDAVGGLRVQYGQKKGWAVSGWADIGEGSDSSSYQLMGTLSYKFDNNIRVIAGYRYYHLEYERGSGRSRRGIDLDYSGPILGISYRF